MSLSLEPMADDVGDLAELPDVDAAVPATAMDPAEAASMYHSVPTAPQALAIRTAARRTGRSSRAHELVLKAASVIDAAARGDVPALRARLAALGGLCVLWAEALPRD